MLRALLLTSAILLGACTPPANQASGDLYLGVLEERAGSVDGEESRRVVRVVFKKDGESWRALSTTATEAPEQMTWTIASDGESLGAITTSAAATTLSADVGRQEIDADQTVPNVGERSEEFAGWPGQSVYRPLIVTSQSNVADPDNWAPAQLTTAQTQSLAQAFRAQFAEATNCVTPEENVASPWAYTDADIAANGVFAGAGWTIANLRLVDYRCDGPPEGGFVAQTYAIAPTGEVHALGQGLLFIDAGDYDSNGASELIFAIDDYNRGGYALFSNAFANQTEFAFSYH